MTLYEYFDRIAIIHLPHRLDRFQSISTELRDLGIEINQSAVQIPHAPVPSDWKGWPSRGVYGNFLSHLGILRQALEDGLQTIWVLEDDAIFSRRMRRKQEALVEMLKGREWGLCFFGHSLTHELADQPPALCLRTPTSSGRIATPSMRALCRVSWHIWSGRSRCPSTIRRVAGSISTEHSRCFVGSTRMWWHSSITPLCRFKRVALVA